MRRRRRCAVAAMQERGVSNFGSQPRIHQRQASGLRARGHGARKLAKLLRRGGSTESARSCRAEWAKRGLLEDCAKQERPGDQRLAIGLSQQHVDRAVRIGVISVSMVCASALCESGAMANKGDAIPRSNRAVSDCRIIFLLSGCGLLPRRVRSRATRAGRSSFESEPLVSSALPAGSGNNEERRLARICGSVDSRVEGRRCPQVILGCANVGGSQ